MTRIKFRPAVLALAATLLMAGGAQGANVLYWSDSTIGSNAMTAALAASSHTVTTAADQADFIAQIGSVSWDLVVFMNQGNTNAPAVAAFGGWIDGGGRAIGADWTRSAALGTSMGSAYTGDDNFTSFTITDAALAVGVSDPTVLLNPGWGRFSMDMDALPGAASAAGFIGGSDAIVIGNGGRTIMNGFLADTFSVLADGVALYTNEINYVLGAGTPVPAPTPLSLVGVALVGLGLLSRRRTVQA